ncbi:MAG: NADH-quinone oxidoreductase subunit L [Cyclobacteriaceae bacterium]|nr:NADH-quinone oxidoreductase subunit L [Cyclobacteriaceae bacterium]
MNQEVTILTLTSSTQLSLVVLFLPLLSFVIMNLWSKNRKLGSYVSSGLFFVNFIIAVFLFITIWNGEPEHSRWLWFEIGSGIQFTSGVWLNNLTVLLLVLVTLVSFMVHLFSLEYMKDDKAYNRYFSFLGLFTFSMLGIVLSDNLLLMFVFWELVGFSSYLLIGFWFHKETAAKASKKAFIVNRIGDLGFLVGLMILWSNYNTLDLTTLISSAEITDPSLTLATLCLFGGVIGKSAQFPLQVWLPDAMEGPTPVSALIHAATMVAAGVFLLARITPFIPIDALHVIALIGAITAFMGGVAALRQFDIKKILAFSTISQLGYMVMGVGASAYDAAIFHLITHAFFKACLFLSAGAIIHSLHKFSHDNDANFDAQDIRLMGGLRRSMPFTFWVFIVSSMALVGVPLFSGFLSKEAILIASLSMTKGWQVIVPILGFGSVLITAFYVMRMLLIIFFGENRLSNIINTSYPSFSKVSLLMKIPLTLLAFSSLFILFSPNPFDGSHSWIINGLSNQLPIEHHSVVPAISVMLVLLGMGLAYAKFKPSSKYIQQIHSEPDYKNLWQSLSFNNWHLDAIYDAVIIRQAIRIADGIKMIEEKLINRFINYFAIFNVILAKILGLFDRYIVDGLVHFSAFASNTIGWLSKNIQSGKAQTHIAWAGLGILMIIIWLIL